MANAYNYWTLIAVTTVAT